MAGFDRDLFRSQLGTDVRPENTGQGQGSPHTARLPWGDSSRSFLHHTQVRMVRALSGSGPLRSASVPPPGTGVQARWKEDSGLHGSRRAWAAYCTTQTAARRSLPPLPVLTLRLSLGHSSASPALPQPPRPSGFPLSSTATTTRARPRHRTNWSPAATQASRRLIGFVRIEARGLWSQPACLSQVLAPPLTRCMNLNKPLDLGFFFCNMGLLQPHGAGRRAQ